MNGLVLLSDDETRSYWDHITGECVHGELRGAKFENWGVEVTTVEAALKRDAQIELSISKPPLLARLALPLMKRVVRGKGFMPPFFHATMQEKDRRRPRQESGLGVVVGARARFYPRGSVAGGVTDDWAGRPLRVWIDDVDGIPKAEWASGAESGERPFQLFTRWYGFSFTYPGCEIFEAR